MDAVAFAAREITHQLLLVAALEVEAGDVGATVDFAAADFHVFDPAGDLFVDGRLGVEVVTVLVDVAQLHRVTHGDVARVGRFEAGEHPEEGRLAGAVRADDADDARGRQRERQVVDEETIAETFGEVLHFDDGVAETGSRRYRDLETVGAALGCFGFGMQFLVRGKTGLALRLASLR